MHMTWKALFWSPTKQEKVVHPIWNCCCIVPVFLEFWIHSRIDRSRSIQRILRVLQLAERYILAVEESHAGPRRFLSHGASFLGHPVTLNVTCSSSSKESIFQVCLMAPVNAHNCGKKILRPLFQVLSHLATQNILHYSMKLCKYSLHFWRNLKIIFEIITKSLNSYLSISLTIHHYECSHWVFVPHVRWLGIQVGLRMKERLTSIPCIQNVPLCPAKWAA